MDGYKYPCIHYCGEWEKTTPYSFIYIHKSAWKLVGFIYLFCTKIWIKTNQWNWQHGQNIANVALLLSTYFYTSFFSLTRFASQKHTNDAFDFVLGPKALKSHNSHEILKSACVCLCVCERLVYHGICYCLSKFDKNVSAFDVFRIHSHPIQ